LPAASGVVLRPGNHGRLYKLRPRTTKPDPGHKSYPYLLRSMAIDASEPGPGYGHHLHPDGARLRDNVFVARPRRSVKYEQVYLRAYETVSTARSSIGSYLGLSNCRRSHSSLDGCTPDQAYFTRLPLRSAANPAEAAIIEAGFFSDNRDQLS